MGRARFWWIGASVVLGVLVGWAVMLPDFQLFNLAGLIALAGYGVLSFVRPLVAVQILVFMVVTGLTNQFSGIAQGTSYTAGHFMVAMLFGAWLISGRARGTPVRRRGLGGWVLAAVVMWIAYTVYGIVSGHPWQFLQLDALPALYLLAFFPIVNVLRDELAVRALLRAVGAALVVLSLGLVFEYLLHYDAPPGNFLTTWGKVYPTEGPAGGPKIVPFAGLWVPAGLLAGLLLAQRGDARHRAVGAFAFAGMMAVALLLIYTRSLLALTVVSILLAAIVMARQPRRAVSMLGAVLIVGAILAVAIPALGGGSPGEVVEGLRGRFTNLWDDPSWEFRRTESRAGFEVFADHVLFGAGFGVIVSIPELEDEGRPPSSHFQNAYAGLLAKTGVVGATVFGSFLLALLFRGLGRGLAGPGYERLTLVAAGSWLVGMALASYSSDFLQVVPGMFYLALYAALVSSLEAREMALEVVAVPVSEPAPPERLASPSRSG